MKILLILLLTVAGCHATLSGELTVKDPQHGVVGTARVTLER